MCADVGNGATSGQHLGAAEKKKWVLKKLGRVGPEKSILSRCAKVKEKGRQAPAMLLGNCR